MPYGEDLTYWQAWWLHVNLKTWSNFAAEGPASLVGSSTTLLFLRRYIYKRGGTQEIAYDLIQGDDTIKQANLRAVHALLSGQTALEATVHFLTPDLATSINSHQVGTRRVEAQS